MKYKMNRVYFISWQTRGYIKVHVKRLFDIVTPLLMHYMHVDRNSSHTIVLKSCISGIIVWNSNMKVMYMKSGILFPEIVHE